MAALKFTLAQVFGVFGDSHIVQDSGRKLRTPSGLVLASEIKVGDEVCLHPQDTRGIPVVSIDPVA